MVGAKMEVRRRAKKCGRPIEAGEPRAAPPHVSRFVAFCLDFEPLSRPAYLLGRTLAGCVAAIMVNRIYH